SRSYSGTARSPRRRGTSTISRRWRSLRRSGQGRGWGDARLPSMGDIEVVAALSAESFQEAVEVADDLWSSHPAAGCDWVFRGHADASWELKPRAWRADGAGILAPFREEGESHAEMMVEQLYRQGTTTPRFGAGRVREVLAQTTAE